MAKVGAIIARSLRILRVVDPDEDPTPRQYETAIEALNSMLSRWEADRLSVGWVPVANPAEDVPAADECHDAIVYGLAVKLRSEYGANLDPDVIEMAQTTYADVLRDFAVAYPIKSQARVPRPNAEWPTSLEELRSGG